MAEATHRDVTVQTPDAALEGFLESPVGASGLVLFAHGSGSSRFSSRNQLVARALNGRGLATLLFDLLTPAESEIDERTRELRFDIALIGQRLVGAIDWCARQGALRDLPIGLFGASTGAAAALLAAAERPGVVRAVVSRGGRPDLAGGALARVRSPVLLLVGSLDRAVIVMNQDAAERMACPHRLEFVPGASHLFEEPGTLELVAEEAAGFFLEHLHAV